MRFSVDLLQRLRGAASVVAFTGAGMSAESGVPTFRGNQGIWTRFKPEELANLESFLRNPALVWEWYSARRRVIREVQPNAGHYALARMEGVFSSLVVVTQNIDNLHRRAGSSRVFELHGNIERNYCIQCGNVPEEQELQSISGIPQCRVCSGLIRPDVVWFGELLPVDEWDGAARAVEEADVVLSIGTSGVVYPAAALPLRGREAGAYTVEINPEETELTRWMDESIRGPSALVLPALLEEIVRGVNGPPGEGK